MPDLQKEIQQKQGFVSLEQETFLNLMRTAGDLSGPFAKLFRAHDLSMPLYNVLRILRGQEGDGLACSQIGERMVARDPDVTRLVDRLVRRDLARRERSETDRRKVLIFITTMGLTRLQALDGPVTALHEKILGHLDAEELAQLNRLLVKARSRN